MVATGVKDKGIKHDNISPHWQHSVFMAFTYTVSALTPVSWHPNSPKSPTAEQKPLETDVGSPYSSRFPAS